MDIRQMVGQAMMTGFDGYEMTEEFISVVRKWKIANVVLFAGNVKDKFQLRNLCASIQALVRAETGTDALIAIDQEGGTVSRLPKDAVIAPGAMTLGATRDARLAYDAGAITAREMRDLGLNVDFAPVMDVNVNPNNPVISVRSYSDDPDLVSEMGTAFMKGLDDNGVLACVKHFPGHGDTEVDSHLGLPLVDKERARLEACELKPFRASVRAGARSVMTAHILFPALESARLPATMSRAILTDLLRGDMGFQGIIFSDGMMMDAIRKEYGTVNGCLRAYEAGVDIALICHHPVIAGEACEAYEAVVQSDERALARLKESCARIQRVKRALAEFNTPPLPDEAEQSRRAARVSDMRTRALTRVDDGTRPLPALGARTLFLGCDPYRANQASDVEDSASFARHMARAFGGAALVTGRDPDDAEIARALQALAQLDSAVVCTVNTKAHPAQAALVRALINTGKPVVVCALRDPYDLAPFIREAVCIATYEYNPRMLSALSGLLAGNYTAEGKLSVKIGE